MFPNFRLGVKGISKCVTGRKEPVCFAEQWMPPRGGSGGADGAGFAHFPLSVAGSGLCRGSPGPGKRLLETSPAAVREWFMGYAHCRKGLAAREPAVVGWRLC